MNHAIDPVNLVQKLMAIPGPPGHEKKILETVVGILRKAGLPRSHITIDNAHRRIPGGGEVGNLIVRLPGTRHAPRRLLVTHLDTVPLCVGARPVRRGNEIVSANPATGVGADNRAGTTILLNTLLAILKQRLDHPPLTFLWTVQEEVGMLGARYCDKKHLGSPRLAFNFDGTNPTKIFCGATGAYRLRIRIHGIASHAGVRPEEGVSAITIAAMAIASLEHNGWHGLILKGKKRGTSNVGVLHGGDATNVVTPLAELRAEIRSHDRLFRKRILREYIKTFQAAARHLRSASRKRGHVTIEQHLEYESFALSQREPSVLAAAAAIRAVGKEPECAIVNGGLDANWLVAHGIPTVTLGTGQRKAHETKESLQIDEFRTACQIALRLATMDVETGGSR